MGCVYAVGFVLFAFCGYLMFSTRWRGWRGGSGGAPSGGGVGGHGWVARLSCLM